MCRETVIRFWHVTLLKCLLMYFRWIVLFLKSRVSCLNVERINRILVPMRNTLLCPGFSLIC